MRKGQIPPRNPVIVATMQSQEALKTAVDAMGAVFNNTVIYETQLQAAEAAIKQLRSDFDAAKAKRQEAVKRSSND